MKDDLREDAQYSKIFEYDVFKTMGIIIGSILSFLICILSISACLIYGHVGFAAMPAIFTFMPILLLRGALDRSPITVNDSHVTARPTGLKKKQIEWSNVRKIRKRLLSNGYYLVEYFEIFDEPHGRFCCFFVNTCGNISFSYDIFDLRELLDRINIYANRYDIPLVVLDHRVSASRNQEIRVVEF